MIQLSEFERAAINPVLEQLSREAQYHVSLESLVEIWGRLVDQIEVGYALTGYDYANDVTSRDLIEYVVKMGPTSLRDSVLTKAVDPIDVRFKAATREIRVALPFSPPHHPGWWWYRIPKDLTGDLARDLLPNP